ncbi:M20 family metallopeptidase [Ktedonobacter racemifer]|uniref:Peptidase M20 n=1 Tax=Ktedonobacter racemifer DSM 44963 TaxID=485913 RepID=D6TPU3_KTERA|nr:M20 family metallopeptidase [Ktedonobacter racemifer]EFH87528.1 peptidase M20 [Ktedonobacter racemifer DSM 44963]
MTEHHPRIDQARQLLPELLKDLEAIVNIDSGTYNKAGVDQVGAYLQKRFTELGFSTSFDPQQEYGNHLIATRKGGNPQGARVLLIGHMDTVFPDGEVEKRPYTQTVLDGREIAKGPGVLDMKVGLLMGMYSVDMLLQEDWNEYQSITFVFNSDEEIGSPASKELITEWARKSDAALVLEPGRTLETVVSARKSSGLYRVEVWGRSAHAGVEPEKGRNAIIELSHQVQAMQALHESFPGVSVNVTSIQGGDRKNVIPDYAYCDMDVRASNMRGIHEIEEAMQRAVRQQHIPETQAQVSGSMRSLPFEHSEVNAPLIRMTQEAGAELGIAIHDVASGGASDANNTSPVGVPTLDGLGAGGGLAHNPDEYVELEYLPERIALLSGLIGRICRQKAFRSISLDKNQRRSRG